MCKTHFQKTQNICIKCVQRRPKCYTNVLCLLRNWYIFLWVLFRNLFVAGQFFGATIFLLSLSSAMTVLIMKLHFNGEHGNRVPPWLRKLVLVCLARVVRMSRTVGHAYDKVMVVAHITGNDAYSHIRQGYILTNLINMSVKLFSTVSIVFFPVDFKSARYHSRFCIFN